MIEKPVSVTGDGARFSVSRNKGLRLPPGYFAQREANRTTLFPNGFLDETATPKMECGISIVTRSQQKVKAFKDKCTIKKQKGNILKNTEPQLFEQLFQDDPRDVCLYTKYFGIKKFSTTDSRESRQNCAWRELMILLRKGRIPTFEIRLNFFIQFRTKWDIDEIRAKIRNCLKYRSISAVIAIGLTRGKDGKPNNTIHLHFLMGDKKCDGNLSKKDEKCRRMEIVGFIRKVCERQGLVDKNDFKIESRKLWNGEKYFEYFVKYGKHGKNIPLFIEGLNMQEFTQTGWFENGEKKRLWDEY